MNILTEIKRDIRSAYLEMRGREIPLAVNETIEALWSEDKQPQISKAAKTEDGYTFTIALPAGISFKDFYSKLDYFKDAAGGNKVNTAITQSGKMAILTITTKLLENYYKYTADYPKAGLLPVPIGYTSKGLEVIDIAKHEHILIGGTTGSGKSNSIHVIVNSLLNLKEPPIIILIDLKMSEYNYLEDRLLLVTDSKMAYQALERLVQEMKARQLILKNSRCVDIQKYRKHGGKMPYIILIIDELAQLKDKDAQEDLEDLLSLSRASGIRIIAATQRPSCQIFKKKSFGDAKANFTCRICYRTLSEVDSRIILDSGEGAKIPKIPGRGYLRIGCDLIEIQTPYLDPEEVVYVDQFSPSGFPKEYESDRDAKGVGSIGHSTNSAASIPLIARCSEAIKSFIGKR